jgi:hypothetical protein
MSEAIVDLRSEANGGRPRRIRFAKREVEFGFVGLRLLRTHDHVGLIGCNLKIAIKPGFVQRTSKALKGDAAVR